MSNSRIPSPARSQGAPMTPRRYKSRTRSVGSPARSTASGRLSALVQFKENNKSSFFISPAPSRRSVLNDDTDIEEPGRRSWWKNLKDNSRDVMEVLNDNKVLETNEAVEEYIDIEVLSQEKKNYSIDIPDSSDSESISSIVIPQRKLFTQKDQAQNKFGQLIGTRETLAKLHKSHVTDKTVNVAPKNLFGQGTKPKSKPIFPTALLNLSPNKTANKTKENVAAEVKGQVRSLFGNRAGTKRKNMFADFIVSESEDDISEIQPRVFGFPKKAATSRETNSRGIRDHSPTSSATDIEMDDWNMLPSSTMVDNQLEDMMVAKTPVKRARLSNLAETKELDKETIIDEIEKEPSDEEQELKYDDDDAKIHEQENEIKDIQNSDTENQKMSEEEIQNESRVNEQDDKAEEHEIITEDENEVKHDKSKMEIQNENEVRIAREDEARAESDDNAVKTPERRARLSNIAATKECEKKTIVEEIEKEPSDEEQELKYDDDGKTNKPESKIKDNEESDTENQKITEDEIQNESKVDDQDNEAKENKIVTEEQEESEVEHDESKMEIENESEVKQREEYDVSKDIAQGESKDDELHNEDKANDGTEDEQQNESVNVAQNENAINMQEIESDEVHRSEQEVVQDNKEQNKREPENRNESEVEIQDKSAKVQDDMVEDVNNESVKQDVIQNETQNESVKIQQEIEDDKQNVSSESLEDGEHNENAEIQEDTEDGERNESAEAQQEMEDDEQNESAKLQQEQEDDEQNESAEIQEESEDDEQNESAEIQEESEDDVQNESAEVQQDMEDDEQNESAEIQEESEDGEQNESAGEHEDSEEGEQNDSAEEQEDSVDGGQNESAEIPDLKDEQNESVGMEVDANNESQEAQEETEDEIQDSNDPQVSDNEQELRNETHDTTGRYRKKNETQVHSPEAILHGKTNQLESFTAQGRNTSVRKTTMLKNLNIRPSLAPPRESTGLSDGTRNSSAEGSGWDSHRTTRKTLRQTFGKDFTPRKSLRALVMEKSAKRQTALNELTSVTAKFPQANSTELPEASMVPDDTEMVEESNHDVSKRTRQTTLEMYLQKIKKQNMERKLKIEEAVVNSLKAPKRDVFNPYQAPPKPIFSKRKPNKMASKTKAKPIKSTLIPLEDLPADVIEDMKYKPPKRFQPSNASWITKRLYKFLESKLESKYDYKARVRAEKLVETIYHFAKDLRRADVAPAAAVDALKNEMARLDVVKTHFDFYQFFHDYMPREIRVKVVPDVVNKINVPRHGVFSDIIRGNTVQG